MSGEAKQAGNHLAWSKRPSVNALAAPLLQRLIADADMLNIKIQRLDNGCTIVDAGIDCRGGLEAGRRIAEICLGGLANITFTGAGLLERWPLSIHIHTTDPVTACLASQYAGWSLSHGEGKQAFHALGSGPGRALACKEELFKDLEYQDQFNAACLVLEVDEIPPTEIIDKVARDCGVSVDEVTLILTPTRSLAGTVQIVARVLEVAMHKTHELGFPLQRVVDGIGSAPLPPPAPDFLNAMGRTNDAILFGGFVQLFVQGDDDSAQTLCNKLPSSASRDYGKPFAQVFKEYKYDFFQIDPMLFSPARVVVSVLDTGTTYEAGAIDGQLVDQSFGVIP